MDSRGGPILEGLAARSHELRTPLNTIVGYSELLLEELEDCEPEAIRADVERIRDAGRQLLALLEDALRVQRAEVARPHREPVSLHALLRGMLPSLQSMLSVDGRRLEWTFARAVHLATDPDQVGPVVRAMIQRAVRVAPTGRIQLSLTTVGNEAHVIVTDEGLRASGASGLELAERTARLLGGRIDVERTAEGTAVHFVLPDARVEEDSLPPARAASPSSGPPVVLVVDDDPVVAEMLERHLAGVNCEIVAALSGAEALRLAARFRPAVITLDVMMPDMDGWETLARLRSIPALAAIPVVMMSAVDHESARGIGLGAAEYLQKPVERATLLTTVERFLPLPRSRVLVVDDDPLARDMMRRLLVTGGYIVDEVSDGRRALDYLRSSRPDLILLDLLMPEMDGFRVVQELQADRELAAIPLVVLTALTLTDEDRARLGHATRAIVEKGGPAEDVLARIIGALEAAQ